MDGVSSSPRIVFLNHELYPIDSRALQNILSDYECHFFTTAYEALNELEGDRVAVCVIGLKLSDTNSIELVKRIRSKSTRTRVILYALHGRFQTVKEALNLGVFAYLEKGDRIDELVSYIRKAVDAWEQDVQAIESRLMAVLNSIPNPLMVLDSTCRMREIYSMHSSLHGIPVSELKTALFTDLVRMEYKVKIQLAVKRVLETGKPEHLTYTTRDWREGEKWYALRMVLLEAEEERLVLSMVRDITDELMAEQALRKAKDQAEEMNRLTSSFIQTMSHEIRTPLTGILGFASIIAEEAAMEHSELATLIQISGRRLLEMLDSVLDLAILEAGQFDVEPAQVNLVDALEEMVLLYRPHAEKKELDFVLEIPEEEVITSVDRRGLDRILKTLIRNAIKFTKEGTIKLALKRAEGRAEIHVMDTGVGISKAFLPHVFGEFKQESTGTSRLYQGSGLGLAVTKRLVDLLGGEIEVASKKHEGSTFSVSFPLHSERPALLEEVLSLESTSSPVRPAVLVVEDDPTARIYVQLLLHSDYQLFMVATPEDAEKFLRRRQADIVLLDINLGSHQSGIDVLHTIRETAGYEQVPVVAMTAYALPHDKERFLNESFTDYLSKPFTKDQLLSLMRRYDTPLS